MPSRKRGYDCSTCPHHADTLVDITRHIATHRAVVTERSATWYALDFAENVVATADDLDGRRAIELAHPGAQIVHRLELKERRGRAVGTV